MSQPYEFYGYPTKHKPCLPPLDISPEAFIKSHSMLFCESMRATITPRACETMRESGRQAACDSCGRNPRATHTVKMAAGETWREQIKAGYAAGEAKRGRKLLPKTIPMVCENPACGEKYTISRGAWINRRCKEKATGMTIASLCGHCRSVKGGKRVQELKGAKSGESGD